MSESRPNPKAAAELGARHFWKLLKIVAGTYLLVLAIQSGHQYISYLQAIPTQTDIYSGLQQRATLVYYAFWLCIAGFAFLLALFRKTSWLASYICLLLVAETVAYVFYIPTHRHLYHPPVLALDTRFEPNPFTIAVPRPGIFGGVTHDTNRRRTTINDGKIANPRLIYAFGGSTTYDVGNADAHTWPSQLSRLLGPNFAVQNYGVPLFDSVENMIQSLFVFRDVAPVCAIYFIGGGDIDKSHIKGLANDYSNYDYPVMAEMLPLGREQGFLERNSVLIALGMSMFAPPKVSFESEGDVHEKDRRLSELYRENIKLISTIARNFGVRPIFVPQILNYAKIGRQMNRIGIQIIFPKDEERLMGLMNDDLADMAAQTQAYYLGSVLTQSWDDSDFLDGAHFSATGSLKFANQISDEVRKICQ